MLTVVVRGTPVPEGSKSAFALRKGGAFKGGARVVDDNRPALAAWRGDIRQAAQAFVDADPDRYPLDGPVVLAVTFTRARTTGLAKRMRWLHWPYKKPDLDKYLRAVLDALQSAGVVRDDGQVVEIVRLAKHFARDDVYPVVTDGEADFMLHLRGTYQDVLSTPGVVVRVAHVTEFSGVQEALAQLGRTPQEVPGGW